MIQSSVVILGITQYEAFGPSSICLDLLTLTLNVSASDRVVALGMMCL